TGIHRDDALVEAGKAALVLGDQLRLERPGAVAWHINAQRTIVGQHRLAAASVAVVAAPTLGVGQVKAQLGPQRPLDHGLLELLENGLDPGRIHRARDQLLKKFRGQIDGRRDHRRLLLAWHTCSLVASWYASHTKFLTPSPALPAAERHGRTAHPHLEGTMCPPTPLREPAARNACDQRLDPVLQLPAAPPGAGHEDTR